jgi:hypothetical protein
MMRAGAATDEVAPRRVAALEILFDEDMSR